MATTEQKRQIDNCLTQLSFLLKKIGVTEFTISSSSQGVTYETGQDINQILLGEFCDFVDELHRTEQIADDRPQTK